MAALPKEAPVGLSGLAAGSFTSTLPAISEPGRRFFKAYTKKGTFARASVGEELV